MKDGPDIARTAALIGDPARANMLSALMDGRALTASELAMHAGIGASTASSHLSRLEQGGLVRMNRQGRHRYYALSGPDVATALEALMGLAQQTGATRVRTGPRDPALRRARVCYDHLAGALGVALYDALLRDGFVALSDESEDSLSLTSIGADRFTALGIDMDRVAKGRRAPCRACLDWSMRRHHLAGGVGAAIWSLIQTRDWANRVADSRVVSFSPDGEQAFRETFGIT